MSTRSHVTRGWKMHGNDYGQLIEQWRTTMVQETTIIKLIIWRCESDPPLLFFIIGQHSASFHPIFQLLHHALHDRHDI